MKPSRTIGGSVFASSRPDILVPFPCHGGTLQVVPDTERDTHLLMFTDKTGKQTELASHPNGFSCHRLLEHLRISDGIKTKDQSEYIVRCGGTSLSLAGMEKVLAPF